MYSVALFSTLRHKKPCRVAPLKWEELIALVTTSEAATPDKMAQPLWSPVLMDPDSEKGKDSVQELSCLVLDYDGKTQSPPHPAELFALWGSYCCLLHTSWSHTPAKPKVRVVLPLSRSVTPEEFYSLFDWAQKTSMASGFEVDKQTRYPSCQWYVASPTRPHYTQLTSDKEVLDVDEILGSTSNQTLPQVLPAGFTGDSFFTDESHTIAVSAWAASAATGDKLKGYCPCASESSYGSAFLSKQNGGTLLVCTSNSHGHPAVPFKVWVSDPIAAPPVVLNQLDWYTTPKGDRKSIKNTAKNLVTLLQYDQRLSGIWYDEFSGNDMWDDKVVTDANDVEIRIYIEGQYGVSYRCKEIREALHFVATANARNPLAEELESYEWDGVSRVSNWIEQAFVVEPNPMVARLGRKFLIAAVARALEPGCKVDTTLIFAGGQGIRKSTCFEILASPQYFSDTELNFKNKDSYLQLQHSWIYELSELDSLRKSEIDTVKAFLSSRYDTYRLPYAARAQKVPRHTLFVGTTNEDTFLHDPTGSRRFWPVKVYFRKGGMEWLKANREQLWAEAVRLYKAQEVWYLEGVEEGELLRNSERFSSEDPWVSDIVVYLDELIAKEFTMSNIMCDVLRLDATRRTMATDKRIGRILRDLGYTRQRRMKEGQRYYYWTHASYQDTQSKEVSNEVGHSGRNGWDGRDGQSLSECRNDAGPLGVAEEDI